MEIGIKMSEEKDYMEEMKCCDDYEAISLGDKVYGKNRFMEEYKCKNCGKVQVFYIRLLRYERYDKKGNLEYDLPLADEPLYDEDKN